MALHSSVITKKIASIEAQAKEAVWDWLKHYQTNELLVFEDQGRELITAPELTFHGIRHEGSMNIIIVAHTDDKEEVSKQFDMLALQDIRWILERFELEYVTVHDWPDA